jgi:hypothetical protein
MRVSEATKANGKALNGRENLKNASRFAVAASGGDTLGAQGTAALKRHCRAAVAGLFVMVCVLGAFSVQAAEPTVKQTMDDIVTRLYATMDLDALVAIDHDSVTKLITDEERNVLATKYWYFDVNVPVVVSVMRHSDQGTMPFWLPESGFEKTDMIVTNTENWEYEVWQKVFDAGRVELGINGFGKHRPHYFVTVGPQQQSDTVEITNLFPGQYSIGTMRRGALLYHDWGSLVVKGLPDSLNRHRILTTVRGRAREAHLVGGFRKTAWPSSKDPDQVILTWSEDPKTTQTVQWRTSTEVSNGVVQYKEKGAGEYQETAATYELLENRLLANDRYCHHYTAVVRGLRPATEHVYRVGSPDAGTWSEEASFVTAPESPAPFTFVSFGDTHQNEDWGKLLEKAFERHPQTAFYAIAGDLVDTGQYRDDWDELFAYSSMVFNQRPVLPCIGNHDTIDGLGPGMYLSQFGLPENGPGHFEKERAYAFEYSNALFLILDSTASQSAQTAWIEDKLANTKATWKFAMFHFPPSYLGRSRSAISPTDHLFDKYHLDMALEGHVHRYMRSHPINRGQPVASPAEGTIHVISIGIPGRGGERQLPSNDYAATKFRGVALYQTFDIDGNKLVYRAYDADGNVKDELIIEK